MKKIIVILLAAIMLFSFACCKGNDNETTGESGESGNQIDAREIADEILEEAEEYESFSIEAVEYYLKKTTGIKLSELEPEWDWQLKNDYCAYADDPDSGYGHAVIKFTKTEGEVTSEEYGKWYNDVFSATAKASDDGYNIRGYEFAGSDEDALGEVTLDEALEGWLMKGWAFRCNDKIYTVYVSEEYDREKDSQIGNLLYYDSAQVDISVGLQKSMSDTLDEAESYLSENEEEVEQAIKDYFG